MSGPIEPHWELLPDQPEAFFDLSSEYDLRDLKSKYNAFIRQFKPEKFPEEFQKIRAAYDCLNDALRYQEPPRSQTVKSDLQFDWDFNDPAKQFQPPEKPNTVQKGKGLATDSVALLLYKKINQESLPKFYDDLQSKESKTPYEYYVLAVCSDILRDSEHSFPYWLLEGLKGFPEEPALFELLRQYFVSEPFHVETAKLLEVTSQVIRSNRFYYLTERAWDEQIRNRSFDAFQKTLLICESNLLDHEVDHMPVFYLHILKTAIWKADEDWINATFSFIDENYDRLPYWIEEELEFLYQLREYREQRTDFLEGGPVRILIDQTIFDYCTKNEQAADQSFLECQYKLASLEEELLREFEVPAAKFDSILLLWEKIAESVYDRIDSLTFEEEGHLVKQNALQLGTWLLTEGPGFRYKLVVDILCYSIGFTLFGALIVALYFLFLILDSFFFKCDQNTWLIICECVDSDCGCKIPTPL